MANKKNVETDKKNTEIKNKKSNELEQKKPTQRKKRRLHSHLKVNIPLFQSLMMILPSLAKHAAAESIDNSSDAADQVTANNVTEKDVTDDHSKADSSAVANQEAQTSDSDVNSTLSASHAPHGSSSHLVPSHHLSTLSHPQVHYIPSVSMPTISSGSNGQPTHSNAPTTPALPVTFMPEVIKGTYGELHVDANGQYTFILNPNSPQYILLNQHQPGTDHFALHLSNGSSIIVQIPVTGKQDTPNISGDLTGVVTEDHNIDSQGLLHANGKIDVIDPDQNESSVTPEVIPGKYGALTIDADGHWQYQVDNSLSNVQALTAATSLHESFTIHTKDGTPQTIDMTIGGNDDNAVITGVDAGTVTEDLTTQVQGQLSVTDSDLGEDHFQASQVTSNFGTLSITKDGAWTYNLDNNNPVVQGLGQGSTATDIVTVHSADGTAHQVTVTINGTNDHAVITSSTANSPSSFFAIGKNNGSSQVTEDKDLTVSGQLNITDIDSKEAHFSNSDLKGTLGTLHLKDNGDWTYDLDNKNPQVQAIGKGSATTDIITIHSADGTPHQITITVNGTNDKAVISGTSTGVVTEESQLQTSGTLAVTDVDTGEAHFSNTDIVGSFGTLHLTDTGSWTYDLDNTNPNVQSLGKGVTATDTITVHSADGTPHQVTITVNGTNDKATVSSATVTIDETDKAVTTSGTLTSTDVDNPDNTFTPDSIIGTNGNLNIDTHGHWIFTANSASNQLNVGDKVEETFTVSSIDGTPSTIKVTINGTNDKATVSSASVAIDETDKAATTSGTLTSTDVDNPDNTFTPDSITGSNGNLNIDAHGQWVFTANSAFNQLNVGDKVEETFTVSSVDGTPSTIKITINGTNDKATVSSANVVVDETDTAATTSGTLTSTDIDNPDNTFTPDSIVGSNGDLTIDANGHWTFTANSAFNQLNVGDKVEETFTVSSVDGTSSTIKVTINGTNDAATVSSATVAVDETDKAVTTSGTLISTDVDNPDNAFTPNSIIGANGNLNIDANGHWTFTANSAFNQLNVGDKVEETFTVNSVDGTPSTIKVTINGTNDAATVSSATVAIDETDKAVTTSGTLTSTDVDNPDNAFTPDSISGTNGDLTIDANGHWTFTANSAFNQLNVGDKVEETFTVNSIDGTPSTIKVTINGTNDKATVSSATVAIDETDKAVTTSGTLTSTDVDNPDNTFTPDSISGTNGDLTIDANGHWAFTANSAFNQLNVGDKVEETFTVSSVDGTPSTVKVTINGTNDQATVSSATVSIDETDKAVTTSGTLTSTDVDNPDNTFTPDSISGTNGNLTIDANGHWTFTANSAFNQLNVGDKVEETFTVSSVDGTPSTIKVTINGTNDVATVSSATVAIDETDKAVTTSGTLTSTDVDNPDNTFTPDSIIGTNGNLNIDAHGQWIFTANSAFNQLNVGDKVEETFTVSSIDGTPSTIKVTINGTNDKATVSSASVAIDETDKAATTSGTLTSTDIDNPDNAFTPDSITGTNGDLTIDANGHWVFIAHSAFNQLNVGDKVEETFTVSSIDGTPSTIKVTINGTNDKATVSTATVSVDETDKAVTTSGTLTSTDVDNPDNTFTPDSIVGSNGDLTIDANGHWTFTANSAFNQLNVGDKVEETFTINSVDGTPSTIKITINGTNDKATVSSATVAIDETDKAVTTSGTLTSIDVDNPDNAFTPDSITGTNGDLTIDASGHWVFTANSAFNQLNVGDKVEETFTVNSVDGTPSTIKVTINGNNDKATVSTATVSVDETDKAVTTSGTLTSTDVDSPDNTFTPDSIIGSNGNLNIDAHGHWTFTANNVFNQLNVGDKVEETFTVSSIDGTPSTIKVTINGTNDKATVSTATVSVDETDSAITTSGTLTSTDVDNPDNTFTPDSISGTNGNLNIDATGHWVFTANSAFNQLNVGDKVEETFTVSSVDGTASTIKVTINGTNDAATVSSAAVAIDETDKAVTTSGTLTSTDVDNPDNAFTPDSIIGANGNLNIDANGRWTFTANSAFNQLNVGDKVEETFTINSVDGTPSTIKITINGTNDKATVSSATVAIDETDKAVTTSGTLTSTDVDNPDNTFTPDSISGTNGNLTIDVNGHWVFTANSAFNQLNVGDKVEETFTVSSIDGTPSTIKVTINGNNDKATVSTATVSVDETDKAVTTSGTLTSTDVDSPDNTFTPDSIIGSNGNLNIDAHGHWTFTANNVFNQLNVGDKVEETFTVSSIDGTPSTIKVTINGTNDKATVSTATVSVDETDSAITTSGTLTSTDVDNPDNTFTPDSISGTNGNLNIDATGHWVFTANSAFNQLNVGDKVEETFTVSSVDGTASTIKVTINGTNDAATVSSAAVAIDETDKAVTTSGTLTSTDVDNPDNAFTPDSIIGANGNLNIDANGRWTFTANSAFNQLNVGDKAEETFTVSSVDGTPSTIKVTINGTNDKATVSSANVAVDETDTAVTTSGTLTSTDVDNPDNTFTPDSIVGSNGDLTIDANGHWTFTANSAFNQLNVGDKVEETFTINSVDGTPSTIKITINGTNDKATVSSATVAIDETDKAVTTSGTLTSIDVDNPDNAFTPDSITGTNGNLTIDASGHWVFTANSAFNQLNVGDKVEETFTVNSVDGTPSTIKVTINGNNDKATVSTATVSVDETDKAVTTSGTLTSTDVDSPDNTFTPDSIIGSNGNLNIDAHGHWTFTANNVFNQLNVGDKVEETFTVSSIDGTPSTIKVTINGTNDAATVSTATVSVDETDKAVTTSGTLTSTDVDNPDNTFAPDSIIGSNGDLTIDANGHWTFTANSAFNQLNVGDKVEETFTVSSVDGTTSTIKVAINGTNDKATVSSATVAIDETDKAVTTSGTLTSTDIDNPDNTFTPDSITGTNGNLNIDANGHWTFTANSAFNQLNVGDKVEETFTVSSVDGTPSTIKVTINGTNDTATVSSAAVSIDETDKAVTTSGTLTSTDVDNPDNTFTPVSISGTNGDLTIDANGHWTFTANSAFNQLNVGDKVEETFTVSSIDGTPSTIKVTINGTNDKATVSSATVAIDETDKAVTTSGTLTSTDIDNPDNTFTPDSISGTNGNLTIDASGHWMFTANSAFNQLNVGDKVEETFTVSSIDGTPSTIKVTINGANDKATVSTATVAIDETDKAVTTSGMLTSTDVDNPDNTFTPDSIVGANGALIIDANGHWTFTANSAFNQLNVGDKVEETFTVSSVDGTPSTIKVTINGTNDKPIIAAQSHSVTEDGQLLQGQMVGTDIDNGAQLTYSVANPVDGLTLNKDGSYSFDPSNSNYQHLADKQTQTLTIPVTITDEHNSSSTENLTITITGTGDAAIIGGVDTGSVIEKTAGDNMSPDFAHSGMATLGNSVLYADGQLTIVDADKGEQGFASHTNAYNYHGTYGDLILNPDGSWHYVADAGSVSHIGGRPTTRGTAIDQLGKGDTLTDTITVHSIDGTTHDIVITINGSNDRPYCSSEVQLNSGKEDAVQTITTSELLSNSVDVDSNDAGKLSVANLHADHGSIRDNHNGTFTFTPNHNYNGNIHFTYDVVDAHSGTTHTGANTTITGTPDQATITEVTTGSVTEDGTHATHNNGITTELAYGQLQVIDPDSGENKFQYSQFGETSIHDPFGGMLRIDSAGNWGYSVDNAALQHLAQGQTETVVYRVHSYDGTAYDLHIDVTGTNDAPAVNKVVLSNGTEDTHYQMQASQFGFTDIDTKDTLHSISITDLPPATQGKFVLDGHDISSGQSIATADISKLQFVPAQDFNGDVQFKYTVNDGHVNSQKATNTLHIDAVSDAAKITGTDTGDVHEGHTFTAPDGSMSGSRVNDRSPDHQHHNTGKLWNDQIHTKGHLNIHDADSGEAHAQNGVYHGHYGQIILQENGDWSYYASIGQDSTGRAIDKLGQGQNLTDTITIKSADGTAHNIVITIHGSNDRPYCSSEVQLNAGTEDTRQTITIGQLLHNTVDVDNNDTGLLTVENLHADHGSIAINSDGSFSFTPEKNHNGNVHFSYDVRDAHGGVTHTGAITSLGAINDNPDNIPVVDSVTEDTDTHHIINLLAGATDVDGNALSISQIQASFEGSTGKLPQGVTVASDGHSLIIDSHAQVFQHLRVGEKSDVVVHYMIDDNHGGQTPAIATITIVGTDDKAGLTSNIIQMSETEAVDSAQHTYKGSLQLVDPDTGDNTQFLFGGRYIGQHYSPGSLNIFPDGSYQFRLQGALNRHANDDIQSLHAGESTDFPYEIKTSDGQTLTIMVRVTGEDSNAQIHVSMPNSLPANQSVTEEHFVPASTTNLYAGGRLHVVDPDHDQSYLQAETINTAHHGHFKISADGGWNYTIDNSIDEVQKLGAGESFTETHTVHSLDGTASQLLTVTVQGTNDAPVVSAQVKLAPGIEDTDIQLNKSDLLSNATDIDHNDIGHLNITNLVADHGVIVDNKDGTFNFHPEPNYNGQVHFSYDVIDGHGGVTHTGASTTLTAVNDSAVFSVDDTGSVKEDVHVQGDSQHTVAVSGVLIVSDPDAGESEFVANRNVHAVSDQFGGDLSIGRAGDWTYSVPNNNLNRLAEGEKHQVTYEVVSRGGDKHQIVITIVGTNDDPILSVTQTTPTTGTLTETDVDVKDMHTFSVVSSTGQFGSLSVDPDTGAYVYTANSSVAGMTYNSATHTYHGTDVFEVKVADNHGGESSKFITFDTNGHVSVVPGQQPTISTTVPVNPLITTTQPSLPTGTNTPPSNAVTLDLAASSDTGISDTDNVTKETTPTITGHTDIPYSQVTVYDGSTSVGHAVSDASGQYSVAVSSLSDGDHNLSAKALAPSSVLPATSSLLSVHIDTQVHVGIQTDPITSDNVVNAQESNSSIDITGSVSGDFNAGDIVTLNVNGTQHTGVVDAKGHYSIAVPGSELIADADQKIEASVAVTDTAGNSAHATADVTYQVDTQVSVPTITFENAGADNLYSKAEIARGQANTITATVTPPGDAKIGEHLVVNGQDHVLDAHTLQHGIQIEVHPGSNVQATMTDEHGNTAGSQGFAASAIPEPIIVRPPSGSHQVSGTLGVPPLLPSLTPVPTAQSGWRIHLPNGQYVTRHHGQYGTLTIDPQTGHLHYQEQAQIHTGPHGSASGIGQHEDRFEVALQGANQDEVVAHVNIQILSHGPGHSGKLTVGTEVVDMTITPVVHTSHPAPPPPPPVQHDEPDMASQADFTVTLSDDSNLDLTQQTHQEPDEKTSHHGAAAYLDALGIKPDATSTTVHDQPADMDIVLAQVDQPDAATHDQAHLDMSDALEHHDVNINHNQDDEHHHHNDVDGLPDIDPNS